MVPSSLNKIEPLAVHTNKKASALSSHLTHRGSPTARPCEYVATEWICRQQKSRLLVLFRGWRIDQRIISVVLCHNHSTGINWRLWTNLVSDLSWDSTKRNLLSYLNKIQSFSCYKCFSVLFRYSDSIHTHTASSQETLICRTVTHVHISRNITIFTSSSQWEILIYPLYQGFSTDVPWNTRVTQEVARYYERNW